MGRIKDYMGFLDEKEGREKLTKNLAMCEMSSTSFKEKYGSAINESNGYITEEILNDAHSLYELEKFYENRKNWFKTGTKNIIALDSDPYVLLFKNEEVYIMESKTFYADEKIFSVNEGVWSWLKSTTASAIQGLGAGVSMVWSFIKSCYNFVKEFDKMGGKWEKIIDVAIPVLAGIVTVIGYASVGAAPVCNLIAGVILCIGGGRHLVKGIQKFKKAAKYFKGIGKVFFPKAKLEKSAKESGEKPDESSGEKPDESQEDTKKINEGGSHSYDFAGGIAKKDPNYKQSENDKKEAEDLQANLNEHAGWSDVIKGLAKLCASVCSIVFGIFDIIQGVAAMGTGSVGGLINKSTHKAAKKLGKEFCNGIPGKIEHYFADLFTGISKVPGVWNLFGTTTLTKDGAKYLSMTALAAAQILVIPFVERICGAVWVTIIAGLETIGNIFKDLFGLPDKFKKMIEDFVEKESKIWIMKMIKKGLKNIILPIVNLLTQVTNPIRDAGAWLTNWAEEQFSVMLVVREIKKWRKDSVLNQSVRNITALDLKSGKPVVDVNTEGVQITEEQKKEMQRLADIADRADRRIEATGKKKSHSDDDYEEMAKKIHEAGQGIGNTYNKIIIDFTEFVKNEADWIELFMYYGIRDGRNLIRNIVYEDNKKFITAIKAHLKEIGCKHVDEEWEYFSKKENKGKLEPLSQEDLAQEESQHESRVYKSQSRRTTSKLAKFDNFKY